VLRPLCLALAALLLALPARAADAPPAVDLALVLAVDVSESVNDERYELQHEGIARAFESAQLAEAVGARPAGAIEVLVLEWSDRDKQVVTVDWTRVSDAASATSFAAQVRATQRSSNGVTAIGDALLAARAAFDRAPSPADRRVIDLSGDGMANMGPPPAGVRDALVAEGITINGLAILAEEPWLDGYYDQNVIGGPGAFLVVAETFDAFENAILNKLLGEIAGTPTRQRFASLSPSPPRDRIAFVSPSPPRVSVGERVGVRGPVTSIAP
jgi:hypothetical protein